MTTTIYLDLETLLIEEKESTRDLPVEKRLYSL